MLSLYISVIYMLSSKYGLAKKCPNQQKWIKNRLVVSISCSRLIKRFNPQNQNIPKHIFECLKFN